jgi:hypothetical protein
MKTSLTKTWYGMCYKLQSNRRSQPVWILGEYCLLGCSAVWFGESLTFWRKILPPSWCFKSKPSKKLAVLPVSCLVYTFILKMEAVCSSKLLCCLQTTQHYNPEDRNHHIHCCRENLKSKISIHVFYFSC